MANSPPIEIGGLEGRVRKLEEICNQVPFDVQAAKEVYDKLYAELGILRNGVFTVMHIASTAETKRRKALEPKPKMQNQVPKAEVEIPSPTQLSRWGLSAPTPNFKTPTSVKDLRELLARTFGASNKPLEFDDKLLEQGMKNAYLELRGDWAVYLTLLAKPASLMRETELEIETGYNIGSVAGCLNRLQEKGLARRVENDLWILC